MNTALQMNNCLYIYTYRNIIAQQTYKVSLHVKRHSESYLRQVMVLTEMRVVSPYYLTFYEDD